MKLQGLPPSPPHNSAGPVARHRASRGRTLSHFDALPHGGYDGSIIAAAARPRPRRARGAAVSVPLVIVCAALLLRGVRARAAASCLRSRLQSRPVVSCPPWCCQSAGGAKGGDEGGIGGGGGAGRARARARVHMASTSPRSYSGPLPRLRRAPSAPVPGVAARASARRGASSPRPCSAAARSSWAA